MHSKKLVKPSFNIQCVNSSLFTWQDAFDRLVKMVNSGHGPNKQAPLSLLQLIEVGEILEENVSIAIDHILLPYGIRPKFTKEVCQQVMYYFPVWWLHSANDVIILNVHELMMSSGCLEALLNVKDEAEIRHT